MVEVQPLCPIKLLTVGEELDSIVSSGFTDSIV